MSPPDSIEVYHFTHVGHLDSIQQGGMVCDSEVGGRLACEAGEPDIKARRRSRLVPVGPGGVVSDYVPFYFAPRSPMLYSIDVGNVPSYVGVQRDLIYLCTTVRQLVGHEVQLVMSDRNASLAFAKFAASPDEWHADEFIDWPLMSARIWKNDDEHPNRKERRMAECLAHRSVPWEAISVIGTYDQNQADSVAAILQGNDHQPRVVVRREWYF